MNIVCIGGEQHNKECYISKLRLQKIQQLAFYTQSEVGFVKAYKEGKVDPAGMLNIEYYDIIPVEKSGVIVDYYAKISGMIIEDSWELYIKRKGYGHYGRWRDDVYES